MVVSGDKRDEAGSAFPAIQRAAALPLFSKKDEIKLLEEYANFADEAHMHTNKWIEFRKRSRLAGKYSAHQIAKKIRRLQTKFEKSKIGASPPRDIHQARVFELSKSLWGIAHKAAVSKPGKRVFDKHNKLPSLLRKKKKPEAEAEAEAKDVGEQQQLEKAWEDFRKKELQLLNKRLLIQRQVCEAILESMKGSQSSTSVMPEEEKKIEEKGTCGVTHLTSDIEFFNDHNLVAEKSNSQSSNKQISSRKKKNDKLGKQVDMKTLPSGLVIEELAKGDPNGKSASPGMKVKVQFIGKLKNSGHVIESTGKASRIISLGCQEMIDGFAIGVDGMRVGGKRKLIIPPSLGFGEEGFDGVIPPNSWLEYDIELVDVCN